MPASATVKGGFWPENGVSTLTLAGEDTYGRHIVARMLGVKGMAQTRGRMFALTGAAPGGVANVARSRVEANVELGGKRTIESESLINRATTAADVTEIKADLLTFSTRTYLPNPPINKDMNPLGTR